MVELMCNGTFEDKDPHKAMEYHGFFNNLTTTKSDDWFDLIQVLASKTTCICILLPLEILLWLRWKLTFLLQTESRCQFCKSIFKICHALSKLSVDCLLLFHECMQCFMWSLSVLTRIFSLFSLWSDWLSSSAIFSENDEDTLQSLPLNVRDQTLMNV